MFGAALWWFRKYKSPHNTRPSRNNIFISWPQTFTLIFEHDLDRVKMNYRAKYLGQMSFPQKIIVWCRQRQMATRTHTAPLVCVMKWKQTYGKQCNISCRRLQRLIKCRIITEVLGPSYRQRFRNGRPGLEGYVINWSRHCDIRHRRKWDVGNGWHVDSDRCPTGIGRMVIQRQLNPTRVMNCNRSRRHPRQIPTCICVRFWNISHYFHLIVNYFLSGAPGLTGPLVFFILLSRID